MTLVTGLRSVEASLIKDDTASGQSYAVRLSRTRCSIWPRYEADDWGFILAAKNVTDERYFRANFPDLFGTTVVLPELPRHYQAKISYKF